MFYRLLIPYLLLPQGIETAIYLNSDIIVNLDIAEFWQIDLGDKPFGAITRASQFKDEEYTKLTVYEETIFDTLTPVWHDKFYTHIMDVKADKEIKIQVEWLPHRSDNQ